MASALPTLCTAVTVGRNNVARTHGAPAALSSFRRLSRFPLRRTSGKHVMRSKGLAATASTCPLSPLVRIEAPSAERSLDDG
jgi:hypothetical protein